MDSRSPKKINIVIQTTSVEPPDKDRPPEHHYVSTRAIITGSSKASKTSFKNILLSPFPNNEDISNVIALYHSDDTEMDEQSTSAESSKGLAFKKQTPLAILMKMTVFRYHQTKKNEFRNPMPIQS
ncbi:hypothetical protein RDI58_028769 [Solanum bulbocastanum]|uniref:Uncharacterized protein n=1 Tax=Solanum bulbocastanum TaxID=147425 RepID=A0AAN8XZB9_SOLBU